MLCKLARRAFARGVNVRDIISAVMKTLRIVTVLCVVLAALAWRVDAEELRDVQYGEVAGVALKLDAHIPDGAGPFRGAILVHGGGWIAGDKQQYITYLFKPLADAEFCLDQHQLPACAEVYVSGAGG